MQKTGPGGMCFLCGGIDGKCRSEPGENNRPLYKCFYVSKKLTIDIDWQLHSEEWADLMGYMINDAPEDAVLVEEKTSDVENAITIEDALSNRLRMAEKLDVILKYLYMKYDVFESQVLTDIQPHMVYCITMYQYLNRLKALESLGYLKIEGLEKGRQPYAYGRLTPSGVFRAEEIYNKKEGSKKVFLAMAFNTKYSESIRNGVNEGCRSLGYIAKAVNEHDYIGDINDRIIYEIKQSKYVIADYSENNQGVYYESGFARGMGITVIETCNEDWFNGFDHHGNKNKLHFDVEHRNMILWNNEIDLAAKIRDRILSLE